MLEAQDRAMRLMPSGWGAPEVFFQKYLKAQESNPDPSLDDVLSAEKGQKLSPATPYNRGGGPSNTIRQVPEIKVNGIDRRWRLDKRSMDLGNGRGISSEVFYDYYDGGNSYLGDFARVRGGRTIYSSPKGNDTIYFNTPTMENGWYKHVGNMVVGSPQHGAKANFFKNLKRPLIRTQQEGGHLNLPTAQKAKERYKGARGIMYGKGNVNIQEIENTDNNAKIRLAIVDNDSTITETPPHSWYITPKDRISDNYAPGGDKRYLDKDWPIMRRRWEEAKQVMSKKPYYAGPLHGTYPLPR